MIWYDMRLAGAVLQARRAQGRVLVASPLLLEERVARGQHHEIGQRRALPEPVGRLLRGVEEERVHVAGVAQRVPERVAQRIAQRVAQGISPAHSPCVVELPRGQKLRLHPEVARVQRVRAEVRRGRCVLLLDDPRGVAVPGVRQPAGGQEARAQTRQIGHGALREAGAAGRTALAGRGGREG